MITRAISPITATLATGDLTFQVFTNGPSAVELDGTFGSVVLSTSTSTVAERTIPSGERFKSDMQDMLFTLTGTGPVVVRVTPLER